MVQCRKRKIETCYGFTSSRCLSCLCLCKGTFKLTPLVVIMAGTGAVAVLLLLAVALLCAYELCAVYVTAGSTAPQRYSPSGFFFGVSAIALAINMLVICRMVFNGMKVFGYHRRMTL
ncbi:hypothetical protein HanPI659440_Chr02g0091441 [Helianthus annuus]|nr:hypothetical protein HanPI659440_Chr02g0091441 [Helianthus annuus]